VNFPGLQSRKKPILCFLQLTKLKQNRAVILREGHPVAARLRSLPAGIDSFSREMLSINTLSVSKKEINMNKLSMTLLASLVSLSTAAFAQQNAGSAGITESTDPGKAAAIEQRAQELASQQQQNAALAAEKKSDASPTKPQKRRTGKSIAKSGKSEQMSSGASTGATDQSSGASAGAGSGSSNK
jgi:hypothetical protein